MMFWLLQTIGAECNAVQIINALGNMVQLILLTFLTNRAVHKDRIQHQANSDELKKIHRR